MRGQGPGLGLAFLPEIDLAGLVGRVVDEGHRSSPRDRGRARSCAPPETSRPVIRSRRLASARGSASVTIGSVPSLSITAASECRVPPGERLHGPVEVRADVDRLAAVALPGFQHPEVRLEAGPGLADIGEELAVGRVRRLGVGAGVRLGPVLELAPLGRRRSRCRCWWTRRGP